MKNPCILKLRERIKKLNHEINDPSIPNKLIGTRFAELLDDSEKVCSGDDYQALTEEFGDAISSLIKVRGIGALRALFEASCDPSGKLCIYKYALMMLV